MSNKENIVPIVLAVLIHVVLLALLLWGFVFKSDENTNKQFVDSPVQAKLVTAPEIPKKNASSLKKRQQKEIDDAKKAIEQDKAEKQKLAEEIKAKENKAQEQAAELEKQKELDKQKEIDKTKALEDKKIADKKLADKKKLEQQEKDKAAAEKKRLADEKKKKAEAEKKRLADIKRKKDEAAKKKKKEAARKLKELEDQMASLDDELFEADKGDVRQTQIMSEVDKIQRAIRAKIIRNWDKPGYEGVCIIRINMGPGGLVLNAQSLEGDDGYCESGETAIKRASPLPSSDDPEVMLVLKTFTMKFDPAAKES